MPRWAGRGCRFRPISVLVWPHCGHHRQGQWAASEDCEPSAVILDHATEHLFVSKRKGRQVLPRLLPPRGSCSQSRQRADSLARSVTGSSRVGRAGLEPATLGLKRTLSRFRLISACLGWCGSMRAYAFRSTFRTSGTSPTPRNGGRSGLGGGAGGLGRAVRLGPRAAHDATHRPFGDPWMLLTAAALATSADQAGHAGHPGRPAAAAAARPPGGHPRRRERREGDLRRGPGRADRGRVRRLRRVRPIRSCWPSGSTRASTCCSASGRASR